MNELKPLKFKINQSLDDTPTTSSKKNDFLLKQGNRLDGHKIINNKHILFSLKAKRRREDSFESGGGVLFFLE